MYDLDGPAESRLANISTRGYVASDDKVMIAGFIAGPADTVTSRVVIRALGPSLSVSGRLMDPTLELHDGNGAKIATNDDYWQDPAAADELQRLNLVPNDQRESALLQVLDPEPIPRLFAARTIPPALAWLKYTISGDTADAAREARTRQFGPTALCAALQQQRPHPFLRRQ